MPLRTLILLLKRILFNNKLFKYNSNIAKHGLIFWKSSQKIENHDVLFKNVLVRCKSHIYYICLIFFNICLHLKRSHVNSTEIYYLLLFNYLVSFLFVTWYKNSVLKNEKKNFEMLWKSQAEVFIGESVKTVEDAIKACKIVLARDGMHFGCVVTLGENGSVFGDKITGEISHFETIKVNVVDSTVCMIRHVLFNLKKKEKINTWNKYHYYIHWRELVMRL